MLLRGQGCRSEGLIAIGLPRADEVAVVAHAMLSKRMGDWFPQSTMLQGHKMLSRSEVSWSFEVISPSAIPSLASNQMGFNSSIPFSSG